MKPIHFLSLLFASVIGYLLYLVMAPFFVPIFWAIVVAILFYPFYKRVLKLTSSETMASAIACLGIAIFLIVPIAAIGALLVEDALGLYHWAEAYIEELSSNGAQDPGKLIAPYVQKYLPAYVDISPAQIEAYAAEAIKTISSRVAAWLAIFAQDLLKSAVNFALAFFTLFFIFKDGPKLFEVAKEILPIPEDERDAIIERCRVVISATMYGGVLVGAVQGLLGGLAFWFLGLPSAALWGFVMMLLSFLPAVGTAIVWGPAAMYLFITGATLKAVLLIVWGVAVVGMADNVLRPIVVSNKTKLHPLLLFFSILGAVSAFGIIGIVAGPIILSVGLMGIELYKNAVKRS